MDKNTLENLNLLFQSKFLNSFVFLLKFSYYHVSRLSGFVYHLHNSLLVGKA